MKKVISTAVMLFLLIQGTVAVPVQSNEVNKAARSYRTLGSNRPPVKPEVSKAARSYRTLGRETPVKPEVNKGARTYRTLGSNQPPPVKPECSGR